MDHAIVWNQVSKRFVRQVALRDVTLKVATGSVFALLGENGAGKTTAIRIALGLVTPDSGSAQVLELDSARQDLEIRQAVGYVSEQPTLYDWMSVDEIGWFAAGFYGNGYLDRFREQAQQFALPAATTIRSLSKGMRAKVALTLALANDPQLLILDEPTSGLDPLVRREFLESMVDRAADGKTVLLSSHQISEVERVADHVAILHQGQIALVASLEELKNATQELTVTLNSDEAELPDVTGEILRQQKRTHQWQLLVRNAPDAAEQLRGQSFVERVDTRMPTLEEIFVAYVTESESESAAALRAASE
jgi:ABC-2 type transport system ATP-binding protein